MCDKMFAFPHAISLRACHRCGFATTITSTIHPVETENLMWSRHFQARNFHADGSDNVYMLTSTDEDIRFVFQLSIVAAYHDLVDLTEDLIAEWRLWNSAEQYKYGAAITPNDDVDLWYNRWRGTVNVCLVFNRSTGAYEVRHNYDETVNGINADNVFAMSKQHSYFGGLLEINNLGSARLEFEIKAQTKLIGGRANIMLDIREYITEGPRPWRPLHPPHPTDHVPYTPTPSPPVERAEPAQRPRPVPRRERRTGTDEARFTYNR